MEFKHKSVLLEETIEGLNIKPDGIYVDGTLGGAGHAREVCKKLSAKGRFIGIDQDQDAIIAASERLAPFKQATVIRSNYCYMVSELAARGINKVDGILLDLGVSSYQLDNEERGFTYRVDAPLDMRMDQRQMQTASDIVNGYEEKELYRIIRDYGEDKFAKNIAKHIVAARGIHKVDGIVLDLGVSSYQLDNEERGFTYRVDAPLDMRMDQRQTQTASDIVNGYEERELYRIIRDYGEDKFAKNIAKHIVAARQQSPIMTTGQLTQIIRESIPMKIQAAGGHPAKRTFQAIRIELNKELDVLRDSLDGMIDLLDDGGRLCIITFHSLEDRIVKTIFRKNENPCTCPPDFPVCVCGKKSKGRVITRKPILPSDEEMEENPRSKSAKLRIFEKKV